MSVPGPVSMSVHHQGADLLPLYHAVRDLNSGTFGFVELAMDKTTGQQVAIKFIERGDKVGVSDARRHARYSCAGVSARASSLMACHHRRKWQSCGTSRMPDHPAEGPCLSSQVTKYVEREIQNHRTLMHPHIVQFKEVSAFTHSTCDNCQITCVSSSFSSPVSTTHSICKGPQCLTAELSVLPGIFDASAPSHRDGIRLGRRHV